MDHFWGCIAHGLVPECHRMEDLWQQAASELKSQEYSSKEHESCGRSSDEGLIRASEFCVTPYVFSREVLDINPQTVSGKSMYQVNIL